MHAKDIKNSLIAEELKKEYLREHLENVKTLINNWIPQLSAPDPFASSGGLWGWQAVYRPPIEQDLDNNHILRRHVRSRALWHHHANWEQILEEIWDLADKVREQAEVMYAKESVNGEGEYTDGYMGVALWKGFDIARGGVLKDWYKPSDERIGVNYGAYGIETSATVAEACLLVAKEHRALIHHVAALKGMKELAGLWRKLLKLQEQMQPIARKTLRSNDILYPCKFCRHLWI